MMRSRTPISLFPFLSVLISTMGVLSFIAVTFLLFSNPNDAALARQQPVEIRWIGAPEYVRPVLIELRKSGLAVLGRDHKTVHEYDFDTLQREVRLIKDLLRDAVETMGSTPMDTQIWVFLKSAIRNHPGLDRAFSGFINDMELDNLSGSGRKSQLERYPIFLIYPDGVETYQLASYIVETTSRLSLGLEPMLGKWVIPYPDHKLGLSPQPTRQTLMTKTNGAMDALKKIPEERDRLPW